MQIVKVRAGVKIIELLMRNTLPHKKFFNGNEIASLLNISLQEIRTWEAEFPQIRSFKTAKGQRIYRREDAVLFASVKHLLKEKKLTIAGAQRVLAESDENYLLGDDAVEAVPPAIQATPLLSHEMVLEEASHLLDEDDEFDDKSHRLYQQCTEDMPQPAKVEPHHMAEMIHDGLVAQKHEAARQGTVSSRDYAKARATLMASRESLNEVLKMLDAYPASSLFTDVPVA